MDRLIATIELSRTQSFPQRMPLSLFHHIDYDVDFRLRRETRSLGTKPAWAREQAG